MNCIHRILSPAVVVLLLVGRSLSAAEPGASASASTLRVQGVQGRAQFSRGGAEFAPLAPGALLQASDVVRTASGSALDIAFGHKLGLLRLTASSVLSLEKTVTEKADASFDLQVTLRSGELLVRCQPLPAPARLEVKTPLGIAQVVSGRCRIQSRAYVVVTDGKTIFAHVPLKGEPAAHTLTAPPACYFTPSTGVQPAPKELAREVNDQLRAKLRTK